MSEPTKSLTDPPKDLKEAIDWVIKIKNDDNNAIRDLAKELEELLKHDGSEVAFRVKGVYEGICKNFCPGCENGFTPARIIKYYLKNLETLEPVKGSGGDDDKKILKRLKDGSTELKTSITKLPENFKAFLGCNDSDLKKFTGDGIIDKSGSSYTPAYQSAEWKPSEAQDCAAILLGIMPVVYIGLTYLYWQCAPVATNSSDKLWQKQNLNGSGCDQGSLKQYMEALGYTENDLNTSKNGGNIVTLMDSMFSGELQKHKSTASSKSYPNFLSELQKPLESKPPQPTSSPLTSLYALSYYYITNFLYVVEPTSPATPSFAGYLGVTALAGGAYGFNLGGLGTFMSALLA
ncbi:variant erythrocyte surface antigen-1 family protein [Babesia caballi]|uniref:Variant erythrocyte surface antigen-1 family protein n=1 Tax=Babesia caballi TaxID=5871 RepID=A0AAV4LYV1_BABCB|nr:variant erythrocyte surface antigen-1 family protein [Babesia caballi]